MRLLRLSAFNAASRCPHGTWATTAPVNSSQITSLVSEEEHADWLESQLKLVRQMGEPLYLSQQVRD